MKNYIKKSNSLKIVSLALATSLVVCGLGGCGPASKSDETGSENGISSDVADSQAAFDGGKGSISGAKKNETVYVEMGADGTVTKTTVSDVLKISGDSNVSDYSGLDGIINVSGDERFSQNSDHNIVWENKGENITYQGTTTKKPPVDIKITYYLDGNKISPTELAGKSGKVKIVYDYENVSKKENGEYIPFLLLTGMVLDEDTFTNIKAENAKIIEHDGSNIVIGYAMPGFKDELADSVPDIEEHIEDIDIPETFSVIADVKNFAMDMTLTAAMSDMDDLKPDEAFDLSEMTDQMDDLQSGADELEDGSKDLNEGALKLADGSKEANEGAHELSGYTSQLAAGTKKLNNNYVTFNSTLLKSLSSAGSGAKKLYDGTSDIKKGAKDLDSGAKALDKGAKDLDAGAKALDTGAGTLDAGAQKLKDGAGSVDTGAKTLAAGISQARASFEDTENSKGLVTGAAELYAGAQSANAGVKQVVSTMQGTPDSIQASINTIITELAPFGITSVEQLDATVTAINAAVAGSPVSLEATIANTDLKTTDNYYALLNAYYSVHTLEQVKSTLEAQIQASGDKVAELLAGMSALETGASTLSGGISQLYAGVQQLDSGAQTLSAGTGELLTGANDLKKGSASLKSGTSNLVKGTKDLTDGTGKLSQGTADLKSGAKTLHKGTGTLYKGTKKLSKGMGKASPKLKNGISDINDAAKAISEGAATLSDGTAALDDGIGTLADGTKELKDGTIKLNDEGISKITDLLGKDAKDAADAIEDILNAGSNYISFGGIADGMDGEVKFIFKTDEIKADTGTEAAEESSANESTDAAEDTSANNE